MYQYIEHAHLIYLHLSPISSRTYVGLCGSFPTRMAMDLGFVAADVLRPAHTPRAQRLVLDSVFVCACDNMNCMYIYNMGVSRVFSQQFRWGSLWWSIGIGHKLFSDKPMWLYNNIYICRREREERTKEKKEQKKTREKNKEKKGRRWMLAVPSA